MNRTDTQKNMPKVWDVVTRVWHWLIALAIPAMWWTAEEKMFDIHFTLGIVVVGLLVFRLSWGIWGSNTSRFVHFLKGPGATMAYLNKLKGSGYRPVFGHNPLGGLSVMAILLSLGVQVGTGLFAQDTDGMYSGPLNRFISYETGDLITQIHETSFNVLVALIALHILAIAFYLFAKKVNLIRPMITGQMSQPPADTKKAELKKPGLILLIVSLALAAGTSLKLLTM